MTSTIQGGCACGAVRYECAADPFVSYACHCTDCRRRTGSAFGIFVHVPSEAVRLTRGTLKTIMRTADSGNRITSHFCGDCGSTLFIENAARPRARTLVGGCLDDPDAFPLQANIWTSSALAWLPIDPNLENFDQGGDWTAYYAHDPDRLKP